MRKRISFHHFDKVLFFAPLAIFIIGLATIFSASFKSGQPLDQMLVARQVLWMGVSVLAVFMLVRVDYFKFQDLAWPGYFLSLFLLAIVLLMPSRMGAHRWIGLGGLNFQPSEFAKLAVILVLSHYLATHRPQFISKRKMLMPFVIVGAPFLLILKEPDLGTALTLLPTLFAMLYLWGMKPKYLVLFLVAGFLMTPILFFFLKEYQKARLLVFMNPNLDPLGAGYTIIQSKIAIGSGGLLGRGFMGGTQNRLHFIPERHTDFIFAVIAEEGGFLVSVIVLILFWLVIRKGYVLSSQTPDRFGSLLACGLTTMLGVQVLVNIGMTMGLLPVVGIPLPLVSYGGTSVLVTMLSIGLLLNIKMHRPLF